MTNIIGIDYQCTPVDQLVYDGNKVLRITKGVNFEACKIILLDNAKIIIEAGASLIADVFFASRNVKIEKE